MIPKAHISAPFPLYLSRESDERWEGSKWFQDCIILLWIQTDCINRILGRKIPSRRYFFFWLKFFFLNINLRILNTLRKIIDIISLLCSDSGAMKAGDPAVLFNSASSPSNTSATPKSAICPYKISNYICCFLAKTYYALCL